MAVISEIFRILPSFKGKLRLASFLLKDRLNKNDSIEFRGKNKVHYRIPNTIENVGKELFINGIYEVKTIKAIKRLLNNSSIFFDVGANIGAISLPLAKTTHANIHAFEPSRSIFQFLKMNVHKNGIKNITLNNCAVHSKNDADIEFFAVEEKYGNSSLAPTFIQQPHYSVKTVSLDAYCTRHAITEIDVLKVDVQGFEIEVLKGCRSLLKRKAIKNIFFEFEGWAEANAKFETGASQDFLLENEYEIFTLKNKKLEAKLESGSLMLWAKPR